MVNEKSSLTKAIVGKTKQVLRYGATTDNVDYIKFKSVNGKPKYRKIRFFENVWRWNRLAEKSQEEILEEGTPLKQKPVTLVTYAICFIMMLAGLSVKSK